MVTAGELEAQIRLTTPVRVENAKLGIERTLYRVEGDIGLDDSEVAAYAAERVALAEAIAAGDDVQKRGLLGMSVGGKMLRWRRGRVLDYCVYRPSFEDDEHYKAVVDGMRDATADWSAICGVQFEHRSELDDGLTQLGDVLFPVVRSPGGGTTVAMAFFPNDTALDKRVVWVFDGFYGGSGFDPVGVLRHELGHVLGFRHEHIRPEAPQIFNPESLDETVDLTKYDPLSVMHYVAPGVGNPQLTFTSSDRDGARRVYGGPDQDYFFAD